MQSEQALFPKKGMKDRKRDYLKERKQRKKGKKLTTEEDEEDLKAEERERIIRTCGAWKSLSP